MCAYPIYIYLTRRLRTLVSCACVYGRTHIVRIIEWKVFK